MKNRCRDNEYIFSAEFITADCSKVCFFGLFFVFLGWVNDLKISSFLKMCFEMLKC